MSTAFITHTIGNLLFHSIRLKMQKQPKSDKLFKSETLIDVIFRDVLFKRGGHSFVLRSMITAWPFISSMSRIHRWQMHLTTTPKMYLFMISLSPLCCWLLLSCYELFFLWKKRHRLFSKFPVNHLFIITNINIVKTTRALAIKWYVYANPVHDNLSILVAATLRRSLLLLYTNCIGFLLFLPFCFAQWRIKFCIFFTTIHS